MFLAGYGTFRFIIEYFREPDAHLEGIYGGVISQGQMLSLPMVIIGLFIMYRAYKKAKLNRTLEGGCHLLQPPQVTISNNHLK